MDSHQFAQWFRASSPYIRAHRNQTFVVVIGRDTLASPQITNIVHDLALLRVLDVQLVLILDLQDEFDGSAAVTDQQIEHSLSDISRCTMQLKAMFTTGLPASQFRNRHIALLSGNFVSTQPAGIVNGVDQQHAGKIRRIHRGEINRCLEEGSILLLPPVGFSARGVVHRLSTEDLIVESADSLRANKVILFQEEEHIEDAEGTPCSHLTTTELADVLAMRTEHEPNAIRLGALLLACQKGVSRCHVISNIIDGALLQELFTHDGCGTQISDGPYCQIRHAITNDVNALVELFEPYVADGSVADRTVEEIRAAIGDFLVAELDGVIVGSVCLYSLEKKMQEIGSLAITPGQQNQQIGDRLLKKAEEQAKLNGAEACYVFTTQAAEWFMDHDYTLTTLEQVPPCGHRSYRATRNSKILLKQLDN